MVVVASSVVIIFSTIKVEPEVENLVNFSADEVQKLVLIKGDEETLLEKVSTEDWSVDSEHIGDSVLIGDFIRKIKDIKKDILVSRNEAKQSQFQVAIGTGSEIKVFGTDEDILAHFFAGKPTANWRGQYFRLNNSEEIFQYNQNIMHLFSQDFIKEEEEAEGVDDEQLPEE